MFGDLTTLAAVRAWLSTGQQPLTTIDDGLLAALITSESGWLQTWLGRDLAMQDWVEIRDGNGGPRLSFAAFPVSAVVSLSINGQPIPPAPPINQQGWTSGYVFTPTQLAVRGWVFARGIQNVAITYTAGYLTPPAEIAQAATELVALRYKERTRIGEASKHIGAETVSYSQQAMPARVAALLARYQAVAPVQGFLTPAMTQTDPATLVAAA